MRFTLLIILLAQGEQPAITQIGFTTEVRCEREAEEIREKLSELPGIRFTLQCVDSGSGFPRACGDRPYRGYGEHT